MGIRQKLRQNEKSFRRNCLLSLYVGLHRYVFSCRFECRFHNFHDAQRLLGFNLERSTLYGVHKLPVHRVEVILDSLRFGQCNFLHGMRISRSHGLGRTGFDFLYLGVPCVVVG